MRACVHKCVYEILNQPTPYCGVGIVFHVLFHNLLLLLLFRIFSFLHHRAGATCLPPKQKLSKTVFGPSTFKRKSSRKMDKDRWKQVDIGGKN